MRTLILKTKNDFFAEALITFLNNIHEKVSVTDISQTKEQHTAIPLTDIDAQANPELLFGIWKDRNVTLEELRNTAWGGRQ